MIDLRQAESEGWLSLREASERMGVSGATLRTWADEGRVESYRTPGGHRRFRVGDRGVSFRAQAGQGEARWRLLEHAAMGRVQLAREQGDLVNPTLPANARTEMRDLERALIQLVTLGLAKGLPEQDTRPQTLGQAYGKWNWRYGVGAREAFLGLGSFRKAYVAALVEFAFGLGDPNPEELNLWIERSSEIIDRVCISMLEYRIEEVVPHGGKRKE